MFLKQKLSKTAKSTIVKNYGRLKGGGAGARPPTPKWYHEMHALNDRTSRRSQV